MTGMSDPALPFLNESVRVPTPRFQPATFPEFIGSTYTLWCHSHTRAHTRPRHTARLRSRFQRHTAAATPPPPATASGMCSTR